MTLYPLILVKGNHIDDVTLKHELIHCLQVKRHGWLYFYISYLVYFTKGLIKYRSWTEAYFDIPYEREAFTHQHTPLTKKERSWIISESWKS